MRHTETAQRGGAAETREMDEAFAQLADEIEIIAAFIEDVECEEIRDRITMWIDFATPLRNIGKLARPKPIPARHMPSSMIRDPMCTSPRKLPTRGTAHSPFLASISEASHPVASTLITAAPALVLLPSSKPPTLARVPP